MKEQTYNLESRTRICPAIDDALRNFLFPLDCRSFKYKSAQELLLGFMSDEKTKTLMKKVLEDPLFDESVKHESEDLTRHYRCETEFCGSQWIKTPEIKQASPDWDEFKRSVFIAETSLCVVEFWKWERSKMLWERETTKRPRFKKRVWFIRHYAPEYEYNDWDCPEASLSFENVFNQIKCYQDEFDTENIDDEHLEMAYLDVPKKDLKLFCATGKIDLEKFEEYCKDLDGTVWGAPSIWRDTLFWPQDVKYGKKRSKQTKIKQLKMDI